MASFNQAWHQNPGLVNTGSSEEIEEITRVNLGRVKIEGEDKKQP